jgi:hypothetical protein
MSVVVRPEMPHSRIRRCGVSRTARPVTHPTHTELRQRGDPASINASDDSCGGGGRSPGGPTRVVVES